MTQDTLYLIVLLFGIREFGAYCSQRLFLTGKPLFERKEDREDGRIVQGGWK